MYFLNYKAIVVSFKKNTLKDESTLEYKLYGLS